MLSWLPPKVFGGTIGLVSMLIKKPKTRSKGEKIGQLKKCEWCNQYLPNERYHLRICPDCRKTTLAAFRKELNWPTLVRLHELSRNTARQMRNWRLYSITFHSFDNLSVKNNLFNLSHIRQSWIDISNFSTKHLESVPCRERCHHCRMAAYSCFNESSQDL